MPGQPARLDLYVLLLHPLTGDFYDEIISQVMLLSKKLVADPCVSERVRRIAWIEARDDDQGGPSLAVIRNT